MQDDRIKLEDKFRAELFDSVLARHNITLLELSKRLDCGYSAVKNWNSGKHLIPKASLDKMLELSGKEFRQEIYRNIIAKYPFNWGVKLGGKNFYRKYKGQMESKMAYVRSFTHQINLPDIDLEIWELLGVCLGDGCLSRYFSEYDNRWLYEIKFTGNMTDDLVYYQTRLIPILRSKFNLRCNYYFRPKYNVICLTIRSKRIFKFFRDLGMPVGKKTQKIRVTKRLLNSPKEVKAAVLRGLLDTDGHIFARKDEGYRYLHLQITSGSKEFLQQLKALIREFGLPAYIHTENVIIRGNENVNLWMQEIGSSHPINIARYYKWITTGKLLPKGS